MATASRLPNVLERIVSDKRREVERLKVTAPLAGLMRRIDRRPPPLEAAIALRGDRVKIIAEMKQASPAKGTLRADFDPAALAETYAANGAAAISTLTESKHFHGSIERLETAADIARPHGAPVLRKDFILDPYQVYESRAYGADFMLLIVAMHDVDALASLRELAQGLGMQCLVEAHDEREVDTALEAGADIIGINNRDLKTFSTDLKTTESLAPRIPDDRAIVSESGIHTPEDVRRVAAAGAHAALVGEALVTADDPGAKLRELA